MSRNSKIIIGANKNVEIFIKSSLKTRFLWFCFGLLFGFFGLLELTTDVFAGLGVLAIAAFGFWNAIIGKVKI